MPNSTQSGDLIAISKNKGWDPTKIWNQDKMQYEESIEPWDHEREPFARNMGQVPGGMPEVEGSKDPTGGPAMSEHVTWEYGQPLREASENGKPRMSLSNPTPGKVGA